MSAILQSDRFHNFPRLTRLGHIHEHYRPNRQDRPDLYKRASGENARCFFSRIVTRDHPRRLQATYGYKDWHEVAVAERVCITSPGNTHLDAVEKAFFCYKEQ